ncbi:MAG: TonB-dependent receptor [Bacteroidales bacterium]|nr:TonB-dependent receptor [Bacteroidales bacterium]
MNAIQLTKKTCASKVLAAFACCICLLGSYSAYAAVASSEAIEEASQVVASGVIVDSQGQPIVGASVVEKGTTNGVMADNNGHFSLNVKAGATLEVSCIGFATQTVKAGANLKITLTEDSTFLDDVVVVGYGTQKKANLTGAVSTVDVAKTLESKTTTTLGKALQGAVPGLTIINTSGNINDDPSVSIRGIGTLTTSNTPPLYIVDGVPIDNINYLNPNDIENISVLKDAASTSIYGTRAAFGVILITTKGGAQAEEKFSVSYTNNFGWSQATNLPNYGTAVDQMYAFCDVNENIKSDPELFGMYFNSPDYQAAAIAWQQKHGGKAGYRKMIAGDDYFFPAGSRQASYVADWDVVGIMFNNATPSQSHSISVQGNTGKTNYYLSFGYNREQGIINFNPDNVQRYTANVNVSSQITKWLKVGARVNYSDKTYNYPYVRQANYTYMWRWGSMFGPWGYFEDEDGNQVDARNMIGYRKTGGDSYDKTRNLRLGAFTTITFTKGLTLNADFTYLFNNTQYKGVGLDSYLVNTWSNIINTDGTLAAANMGSSTFIETSRSFKTGYNTNIYGKYEATWGGKHNFAAMLGFNADESDYQYLYYENHDIQDPNLPELALTPTFYSYSQSHTQTGSAGFFGRINYNYDNRYFVELNGRYDGSSKFPKAHRWAFFPSVSAGWRISEEAFFQPLKPAVSNAKIRASYGSIGNQEIGSDVFLETMSKQSNAVNWLGTGSSKYSYFSMPSMVDPTLTWETINTLDLGLDLGFMNGDLNVTFDWFQRETIGMLAPGKTLPSVIGTSAAKENAGNLRSRGWEFSIDWHHTFGEWSVYAIGNLSDYKTVVTHWDNDSPLLNTTYTGKTYGDIWGFETVGYFANPADVANSASQKALESGSFVYGTGDIKFKDQNGDGVIDWGKGTEEDHGDLVKIGNSQPRYQYSLRVGAAWKGIDLDLYFQGVGKREIWTTSQFVMPYSRGADAIYASQMNYITNAEVAAAIAGTGTIDQSKSQPRLYASEGSQGKASSNILAIGRYNFYPQSRYILNMAYLRLKNVTLGYTIPQNLTKKISIEKIRIYGTINNALDIINHNRQSGIDPEINEKSGYDWGRVDPLLRTYSFGVQVTF